MSENRATPPRRNRAGNALKAVLYLLLFLFTAVVVYRYYFAGGNAINRADYTDIPEEYQVQYMPADFKSEVDEETALAIMANPHRYRREFNDLVKQVNMSILYHVANRMGFADSLKTRLLPEYEKHHPYLRNLYFNDFIQMKDTTSNLYQSWYNKEATTSVEILNEIASRYTCFLVNHVITAILKTYEGKIAATGSGLNTPCGIAMTEGLRPMIERMQERAAIADFSSSRGLIEEKVEKVIAELATMEVRDKKGLNKKLNTKVLGYSVSTTDVEIIAISILKVGFKLDKYFDISLNEKLGEVVVTLPEPQILSHEVFPKVDKLDIGWMREISTEDFNRIFDALRTDFRQDALESDIMDKSKTQAADLMNTMLSPVVSSLNPRYKIKVRYRRTTPQYDDDFSDPLEPEKISIQEGDKKILKPFD